MITHFGDQYGSAMITHFGEISVDLHLLHDVIRILDVVRLADVDVVIRVVVPLEFLLIF